jgi:hypothetical protein
MLLPLSLSLSPSIGLSVLVEGAPEVLGGIGFHFVVEDCGWMVFCGYEVLALDMSICD